MDQSSNVITWFKDACLEARGKTGAQYIVSYLTWVSIAVTLGGAVLAAFGVCMGGCTDARNYRFFGVPFAEAGILFFLLLALTSYGRNCGRAHIGNLYDCLLAGILGAECIFLGVQGGILKHYCSACVAIAFGVFCAAGLRLVEVSQANRSTEKAEKNGIKKNALTLVKPLTIVGAAYAGLFIALIGTSSAVNAAGSVKLSQDIWLGKVDSNIEVLYVGDWYCPFCRQVEPTVESTLPEIAKTARYTFIDNPVHPESYAFIPVNMSLLLNSKHQYLEGRKTLLDLADRPKDPTEVEILAALKEKGIVFRLGNDSQLKELARAEAGFIYENKIKLTPALIIRNNRTGYQKTLVGPEEITRDRITVYLAEISAK